MNTQQTAQMGNAIARRLRTRAAWRRAPHAQRGFLLITVLLVVSIVSMAALNFSESMLIAHESSRLDGQRFQARMMVESGIQVARVFISSTPVVRAEKGGTWDNPQKFQAINVVPNINPVFRGNVSFLAPSLDQAGAINGFRYGLQNESAKLNLNALVQLDKLSKTLSSASSALGGLASAAGAAGAAGGQATGQPAGGGGQTQGGQAAGQAQQLTGPGGGRGGQGGGGGGAAGVFGMAPAGGTQGGSTGSSSLASDATATQSLGAKMLLGIPGMTEEVADAILDFMDEDEDARTYGCEYADYYQQLQPAYRPLNGGLTSIEQLLLVRGVTPQLLYGYDQNRNGVLDASEQNQMMMGVQVGGAPGATAATAAATTNTSTSDGTQVMQPSPLGWAPYLTLHSQEKNVAADGTKRVNINADDLQQLQTDLEAAGVNELYVSYIIGYRIGGQPPPGAGSPLQTLLTASAASSDQTGMLGQQLSALTQATAGQGAQAGQQAGQQKQAWTSSALGSVDLATQQGSVKFNQVLDLVGSSVTIGGQGAQGGQAAGGQPQGAQPQGGQAQGQQGGGQGGTSYKSPIEDSPLALADALPILMDKLTTVDSEAMPGRINIMECPREILIGMPGLTEEIAQKILEARVDGSETENRKFETWLAVEGIITLDQMRGLLPLMTCGGDVFKTQIIGYFEGSAPFCRVEAIISGIGATPNVLFFRRLDHLGRGFDVMTLGQRTDVGTMPSTIKR